MAGTQPSQMLCKASDFATFTAITALLLLLLQAALWISFILC
jgi:hypothetical protein